MPEVIDERALLSGWAWYPGPPAARAVVLTYSFSTTPSPAIAALSPQAAAGFGAFDAIARDEARQALAAWSLVSGITFIETVAHEGDITFGLYSVALLGAPGFVGLGGYPETGATLEAGGALHLTGDADTIGGDVAVDSLYRGIAQDDLMHVLLHEIGHALGLKHPFAGETILEPSYDDGLLTVMGYAALRMSHLGALDIAAVRALYGLPGAAGVGSWSWDAASETLTQTVSAARQYVRGTGARDIITATGEGSAVVAMQGDDMVRAAGQGIDVDGGDGFDVVEAGRALGVWNIVANGEVRELRDGAFLMQRYIGVERVDFLDGSYDMASGVFTRNGALPEPPGPPDPPDPPTPPAAPVPGRWWIGQDGVLALTGTGSAGSIVSVRVSSGQASSALVAADGRWTLTLPWLSGNMPLSILAEADDLASTELPFATAQIGGDSNEGLNAISERRAFLRGGGGDDILFGGPGDDLMDGGSGTDVLHLGIQRTLVRLGISGTTTILRGPGGTDTLHDVEQINFSDTGPLSLADLLAGADELMGISRGGVPGFLLPDPYVGPAEGLQTQALGSNEGEVVGGTARNDFISLFDGSDATNGLAGDDVLDGGLGSNFITGGPGIDKFFLDGRSGGATWSTITDWEAGEQLALWGWLPGTSTAEWAELDGAPGWQGVTMRADLDGSGSADAIVTWTGRTRAELPGPADLDGLRWFF